MAAVAIFVSIIAGAHAETSQVKMPDGRIVQCDLPPKHSDRVGKCADGELIVWNDRDQSYYVTAPQQNGPTWRQHRHSRVRASDDRPSSPAMMLGGLATSQ